MQRQAAHVAHEDGAARRERVHRLAEHVDEVARVREVLHDRVDDDEIEAARTDAADLVRRALDQLDVRQGAPREPRARRRASTAGEKSTPT